MLVGISIELLQPSFELLQPGFLFLHQPLFFVTAKLPQSSPPPNPAVELNSQTNCGNGSTPDTT